MNIISSFSGNTEETISSFKEAIENDLPCVGISSGGKVEEICRKNNIPHVKLAIESEKFQPRMATGYFFASIFQILVNAGMVADKTSNLIELAGKIEKDAANLEEEGKRLAKKLVKKTPIICSSTKYKSLAMIWKIKINENAKTPSFWNFFPEFNHNEMIGFTNSQTDYFILMLKDPKDHPRNIERFKITADVLREKGIESEIVEMKEGEEFYNIFSSISLGDWVSYYLALEYGQNPTPIDMVEKFKKLLK